MKNKKIIKILLLLLIIYSLSILIYTINKQLQKDDTAPEESSALYGGQIANNEYPYAGYLISYDDANNANICGTVYLSNSTAISAAHCFKGKSIAYLGYSLFNFNLNQNFLAEDIVLNPDWDNQNIKSDIAVIKLPSDFYEVNEYAQITSPKIGCNFEVLGYGKTEDDNKRSQLVKLRKKAQFCIEEIDKQTFTLRGKDGGICFGDSGSPIFEKDTNKVVGLISSITTTKSKEDENPCSIGNRAVAVRIDQKVRFINNTQNQIFRKTDNALCGETCQNKRCAFGLICTTEKICKGLNGSCKATNGEYCSVFSGLECEENYECVLNRCKARKDVKNFVSVLESDLDLENYSDIQNKQKNVLSKINKIIYYPIFGILILMVILIISNKFKRNF